MSQIIWKLQPHSLEDTYKVNGRVSGHTKFFHFQVIQRVALVLFDI